jgi:hypothetical protein
MASADKSFMMVMVFPRVVFAAYVQANQEGSVNGAFGPMQAMAYWLATPMS